jgi:hypothetical protein
MASECSCCKKIVLIEYTANKEPGVSFASKVGDKYYCNECETLAYFVEDFAKPTFGKTISESNKKSNISSRESSKSPTIITYRCPGCKEETTKTIEKKCQLCGTKCPLK